MENNNVDKNMTSEEGNANELKGKNDVENIEPKVDVNDVQEKSNEIVSKEPINMTREIIDWALHIIGAVAIALLIVKFVAQVTVVVGTSMEPTLHNSNRLIMEKITPRFGTLHHGDIIVVEAEKELARYGASIDKSPLIKRVVGLEGDHVVVKNGKVFLNGKQLTENYIYGNYTYTDPEKNVDVTVAKDEIFVMGDNRPQGRSIDSRVLGTFEKNQVIGRVLFRLYPFDEIGGLNK